MSKEMQLKNEMRMMLMECKAEMAGAGISPRGWDTVVDTIKELCRRWAEAEAMARVMKEHLGEQIPPETEDVYGHFMNMEMYKQEFLEMYPEEWCND